jgi:hypothetical protein
MAALKSALSDNRLGAEKRLDQSGTCMTNDLSRLSVDQSLTDILKSAYGLSVSGDVVSMQP